MIDFPFSFEVIETDDDLNLMVVRYRADGLETLDVSMPYPFEGVDLQDHIQSYAPAFNWVIAKKPRQKLAVGFTGTITAKVPVHNEPVQNIELSDLSEQEILDLVNELKNAS